MAMSSSVRATSTPSPANVDSVVWKLLGTGLWLLKWLWMPTQSIGMPRDFTSLTMLTAATVLAEVGFSRLKSL